MSLTRLATINQHTEPWTAGDPAFVDLNRVCAVKPKTLGLADRGRQICSTLLTVGGEIDVFDPPQAISDLVEQAAAAAFGRRRRFAELRRVAPFNES